MDVPGEVQVDLFHRHDLGHAAAGSATFDAEERSGRRLPQTEGDLGANPPESLRQADGARRLPLPCTRARDGGHDNQTPPPTTSQTPQGIEADLGLVRPIGDHLGVQQTEVPADVQHWSKPVRLDGFERLRRLTHDPSCAGCINFDLGFAASSSLTSVFATSSAEPGRSSGSPHRQASRYASISVDPSFIAKASIAAWKRSGSMRFTSPRSSQAL